MKSIVFPVPSISEQKRIVGLLKEALILVKRYDKKQDALNYLNERINVKIQKSILQEAIQGRLVPQIAEEGSATELLEQIKAEKQRLVKDGKLKKSALVDSVIYKGDDNKYYEQVGKQIVDITKVIPFEIPSSWIWIRGKNLLMPMESTKPVQGVFTYIDVDAVDNKQNIITKAKSIESSAAPSRATRKLHSGDVLFSMVRPYLRNIAIVEEQYANAIASTGFYVLTPCRGVDSKYLFYMMLSSYAVDGLNTYMKGENSPSINNCHIEEFLCPLPPISEQKRIVEKIEETFSKL